MLSTYEVWSMPLRRSENLFSYSENARILSECGQNNFSVLNCHPAIHGNWCISATFPPTMRFPKGSGSTPQAIKYESTFNCKSASETLRGSVISYKRGEKPSCGQHLAAARWPAVFSSMSMGFDANPRSSADAGR